MENTPSPQPNNVETSQDATTTKSSSARTISAIAISIILTAMIVGVGMYFWQQRELRLMEEQFQQEISVIEDGQATESPVLVENEQATVSPTVPDEEQIRAALATAHNLPLAEVTNLTLDANNGQYARGKASIGAGLGTYGIFYVAKQNGQWAIVADGNGIPECAKFDAYQFTRDMYQGCVEANGQLRATQPTASAQSQGLIIAE